MDDGTGVTLKIRKRNAPRVLLRPGHRTTVELWYDPSYAGLTLEVAAMDGGRVTFPGNRNFVAPAERSFSSLATHSSRASIGLW